MPENFIFIAFYLQLSKRVYSTAFLSLLLNIASVYTNAYLATLNNRESLRERSTQQSGFVSVHLSRVGARSGSGGEPSPIDTKVCEVLYVPVSTG